MAIPEVPGFEQFFRSIRTDAPTSGYLSEMALPGEIRLEAEGLQKGSPITLYYKEDGGIKLESILKKVEIELTAAGHLANRSVILALLCVVAHARKSLGISVAEFNFVLQHIVPLKAYQYVLMPPVLPQGFLKDFAFGPFKVGRLDSELLELRCRKTGSADFFKQVGDRIEGYLSVQRIVHPLPALNWPTVLTRLVPQPPQYLLRDIVPYIDLYFDMIAQKLITTFWDTFLDEQHVLIAMGAPYLDERMLQKTFGWQSVTVFHGLSCGAAEQGWLSSVLQGPMVMDFASADKRIPATIEKLKREFEFQGYVPKRKFHQLLRTYALFLSKAKRHFGDGRVDESFLHFICALDIAFGEVQQTTKAVSRRTAVLVHKPLQKSYADSIKIVEALYDQRSRYVHEGLLIDPKIVKDAENICLIVLEAILRMQQLPPDKSSEKEWLKKIDFVAAALEANSTSRLSQQDWREIGMHFSTTSV